MHEHDHDRIRAHSNDAVNRRIDIEMEAIIGAVAARGDDAIAERLVELDQEWDIERYLETTASTFMLAGIALGARNRRLLLFPAVIAAFLLQHALQGWCPPLSVFRGLGVRSRKEIDREKFALKALRGDFLGAAQPGEALAAART